MRATFSSLLIMLLILQGCNRARFVSEETLKKYPHNPENGLVKKIEKGNTILEMYYKPTDLIVAQELRGIKDPKERQVITKRYDSLDYFILRLSRNGKEIENGYVGDPKKFNEVINYLSFDISKDLFMISNGDTIQVMDVAYARSFGATDATSVMAVFKSNLKTKNANAKIFFDDTVFDTGLNEFEFENKDIKNTPKLKLN